MHISTDDWTSNRFILKRWPWDVSTGMETKALEQKRKWRCFSTRQHNQFQVTFYIKGRTIVTVGQSAGMSASLANASVYTAETKAKKKSRAPFFSFPVGPVPRASLENLFPQRTGLWKKKIRNDWPESHLRLGLKSGRSVKLTARLEDSVVTQSPVTSEAWSCALNLSLTLSVSRWKCSSSENREKSVGSCTTSTSYLAVCPLWSDQQHAINKCDPLEPLTFTNFWHFKMFYLKKKGYCRICRWICFHYLPESTYLNCIALFVIAGMVV